MHQETQDIGATSKNLSCTNPLGARVKAEQSDKNPEILGTKTAS